MVTVDSVTKNYTIGCATCKGTIEIPSRLCELDVAMSSRGTPIAPWEAMWVVTHDNITYVGGWESELHIRSFDVRGVGLLNQDPHSKDDTCHECPHPPPPAKTRPGGSGDESNDKEDKDKSGDTNSTGSGRPGGDNGPGTGPAPPKPKQPAKVRLDIFDQQKNGKRHALVIVL